MQRARRGSPGSGRRRRRRPQWAGAQSCRAPSLHFLHLLLPHTPWTYLPSGTRYFNVPGLPVDGQWWSRLALQRHELQLQYTDWLLGETLRVLEDSGRYQDTLLVVTADHGVSLTPGAAGRELDPAGQAADRAGVGAAVHQGARAAEPGWSTTATGSRSTCCRPWPTWRGSRCRG